MTSKLLTRQRLNAELAGLEELLASLPEEDIIGQISLSSRRDSLVRALQALETTPDNRAQVALYFGGAPVIGSSGIEARFGGDGLAQFQDLLTKVWASNKGTLKHMGRIPDEARSHLHITSLVHGSFGFLLEELDENEPLFETSMRAAADAAVACIAKFADENDASFTQTLEQLHPRVFAAVRGFFEVVHRAGATFRIVEGETDIRFDSSAVERAWDRIEASRVDERELNVEGRLLGMIPIGRRFEFEADGFQKVIEGKVGERFSEHYLERMQTEQFAGRRWKAVLLYKVVELKGRRPKETYTLLELDEIGSPPRPATA